MNMSKLSKLEKDLRSSAKLNKFQALKLKGGDDKRDRNNPGSTFTGAGSTPTGGFPPNGDN